MTKEIHSKNAEHVFHYLDELTGRVDDLSNQINKNPGKEYGLQKNKNANKLLQSIIHAIGFVITVFYAARIEAASFLALCKKRFLHSIWPFTFAQVGMTMRQKDKADSRKLPPK